jgi:PAS domain S-box-containing protein
MTDIVLHAIKDLGLLAMLAVGLLLLRPLTETLGRRVVRETATGLMFGAVAAIVMLDPVLLPEGATLDPRAAPAILAGVFGGPVAAAVAAAIGGAARWWLVGGPVALGGVVGFLLYGAFGAAAGWWLRRTGSGLTAPVFVALGALGTLAVLPAFFVSADWDTGTAILAKAWPMLLAANLAGTLVVGTIVEQAQRWGRVRDLLREAESHAQRLSLVARETTNAVIITDAKGRIEWVNEGFTRVCGYSAEEALGKTPGSLLQGPETDPAEVARIRERLRHGQGFEAELVNYTKDGRAYWVHIDCAPFHEPGQPLRFMAIESDVTERKSLEQRLLRAEQVGSMGHWALDAQTGQIVWSTQTFRIFDLPTDAPIPPLEEAIEYYHPDDRREVRRALAQASETGEGFSFRLRLVTSRALKWVDVRGECERGEGGRARRFFGIVQDVTEIVAREEELRCARDAAAAASQVKSEFLATMSHELRTPLNAISGYSEIMAAEMFGPLGSERYRDYAQDIQSSATYLRELIEGVLELSSMEAGRPEPSLAATPVREVAEEAAALVEHAAAARGVALCNCVDAAATVVADRRALKQMLVNCLENAVKFSKPGEALVELRSRSDGGIWHIEVADNGHGIPADKLAHVTQPFFRAHAGGSGTVATVGGTGIGLALVERFARQMNGSLTLESEEGAGTTVDIALPDSRVAAFPPARAAATASERRERIEAGQAV